MAMRDIGSHAPRLKAMGRPKALGSRRSGRAGEPAAGESVGASESLADVPHRPRLPSYPADRLRDLYGSISRTFGISRAELFAKVLQDGHLDQPSATPLTKLSCARRHGPILPCLTHIFCP